MTLSLPQHAIVGKIVNKFIKDIERFVNELLYFIEKDQKWVSQKVGHVTCVRRYIQSDRIFRDTRTVSMERLFSAVSVENVSNGRTIWPNMKLNVVGNL